MQTWSFFHAHSTQLATVKLSQGDLVLLGHFSVLFMQ